MQNRVKSILLICLLVILWIPFVQGLFSFWSETKLTGAYVEPEKPEFVADSFFLGSFQKKYEVYQDYNFGFRAFLIKLKNSIEFVTFSEIDNGDIMAGKNDYLYSIGSTERTLKGRYYNGKEKNDLTIQRIKFLKEKIEARGGHFATIIVPSKESVLPEMLPRKYRGVSSLYSDYRDFAEGYRREQIPFIDLRNYFNKIKASAEYPLFTKTGFHWSVYGALLAEDTILKYCQSFLDKPMPSYSVKGIVKSDTARFADADFEEVMNLLFSLQEGPYYYPEVTMNTISAQNKRPKVIIIGDSFFWQIKNLKHLMQIFSDQSRFWYYFKTSFPLSDEMGQEIKDVDVLTELESADFVFLVGSLGTLGEFPFGVTDYYYDNFSKPRTPKIEFHLKASNGKYVCADEARNGLVVADRTTASAWETFTLIPVDSNRYAIHSGSGKYWSAELGSKSEITASRDKMADWEIFTMERIQDSLVAFKAANRKYLTVINGSLQLYASANDIGPNEKFVFIEKR